MSTLSDKQMQSNTDFDIHRIGESLVSAGKLRDGDIDRILARQQEKNILFGEAAKQLNLITDDDLKRVLSEQFGYAYVYEDQTQKLHRSLVAAHEPFGSTVEGLRSLREQLTVRWFNKGQKTLAITSINKSEGANKLTANLAVLFSQLNKKTLLIDADLRQPTQHQLFGISDKVGLSNILANRKGQYELEREKTLPNLSILTAGTEAPNPQELLNRPIFAKLISDLEKIYDVILIDTTPADAGLDYLAVMSIAKAAVLVAQKNKTILDDLVSLKAQLDTTETQIVGSVLLGQ